MKDNFNNSKLYSELYPNTFNCILRLIEVEKYTGVENFKKEHKKEVLRLFVDEATNDQLIYHSDYPIEKELASYLVNLKAANCEEASESATTLMWKNYHLEIDDIFDEAQIYHKRETGNVYEDENEEHKVIDDRERIADMNTFFKGNLVLNEPFNIINSMIGFKLI